PLCCLLLNLTQNKSNTRKPVHYLYSTAIFATAIPGLFASIIVFYSLFFIKTNLLNSNVVLYFLPIISMAATFFIVGRRVGFDILPGFVRLSGLMILLGVICLVVFFLYRLRFVIGFFASIEQLVMIGVFLYIITKVGFAKLKGKD
ncbi:MAG: hypothetical protein ACI8WB_003575, partial [Phenylobacterium sp.]